MAATATQYDIPLSLEGDDHPRGASLVDFFVNGSVEADGAHDSVAKLLVHDSLEGIAIVLDDFVQTVDQGLNWRHGACPAAVRESHHLLGNGFFRNTEQLGQLVDILGRSLDLPVEQAGNGNFTPPQMLGNGLEGQALVCLGLKERLGVSREAASGRTLCGPSLSIGLL